MTMMPEQRGVSPVFHAKHTDFIGCFASVRGARNTTTGLGRHRPPLDQATLTLTAWQDGLPIEANADILPAAWLAVRNVVVVPPVDAPTSPERAYDLVRR